MITKEKINSSYTGQTYVFMDSPYEARLTIIFNKNDH